MHSAEEIAAVAAALNSGTRKTLDWKTPAEAIDQLLLTANKDDVATTALESRRCRSAFGFAAPFGCASGSRADGAWTRL
jgi:hypothetical protein